jgi:hypothetical protein
MTGFIGHPRRCAVQQDDVAPWAVHEMECPDLRTNGADTAPRRGPCSYLVDSEDLVSAVDWFLGMNADQLGNERVTQDVLLLCGERDSFQPPMLARAQADALTAASSVTLRIFTKGESADQHCQIGNVDLACRVLTTWLPESLVSAAPTATCPFRAI